MNVMLSKDCTTVLRWMRQTSEDSPHFARCDCTEMAKGVRVHCEVTVNCLSVNRKKGTVQPMAMAHLVLVDTKQVVRDGGLSVRLHAFPDGEDSCDRGADRRERFQQGHGVIQIRPFTFCLSGTGAGRYI